MTPSQIFRVWRAEVSRWHHSIDHRLRNSGDTIQAHQCRVAQLLSMIFQDCTKDELLEAIMHDVAESWTGDVSYTAKQTPIIRDAHNWAEADTALRLGLPAVTSPRVKLCDGIDCILWANSRAPDTMHANGWPEHVRAVLSQARSLGVGDVVAEIFKKAGIR